jgi:hypothetical protein
VPKLSVIFGEIFLVPMRILSIKMGSWSLAPSSSVISIISYAIIIGIYIIVIVNVVTQRERSKQ